MEYKSTAILLLEELREKIENASTTAFSSEKAVVDKNDTVQLIDNVLEAVEKELREYHEITDRRTSIISKAKNDAEEIMYQAEKNASRIRVSKRRDGELQAFRESELSTDEKKNLRAAGDIYAASLIYTDEMLTEVDHLVNDSLHKIELEYERMEKTLKEKVNEISQNKAELIGNLDELTQQDRYGQILELSDLLANELYDEREKVKAREKEEKMQMRLNLEKSDEKEKMRSDVKIREKEETPIKEDRTEVKINPDPTPELSIPVMDRTSEKNGNIHSKTKKEGR